MHDPRKVLPEWKLYRAVEYKLINESSALCLQVMNIHERKTEKIFIFSYQQILEHFWTSLAVKGYTWNGSITIIREATPSETDTHKLCASQTTQSGWTSQAMLGRAWDRWEEVDLQPRAKPSSGCPKDLGWTHASTAGLCQAQLAMKSGDPDWHLYRL